jgi:hypothetical protein
MEPDKPKTYRYQSVLDECLGGGNRGVIVIFQLDFLPSVGVTPVLIQRRYAIAGAWKSFERLVRDRKASDAWNPQCVAGVATDELEVQLLSTSPL